MTIQNNINLGNKTTIGVGGNAKYYVDINDENELIETYKFAKENKLSIIPLGLGSNTFFYNDINDKIVVGIKNKGIDDLGNGNFKIGAGMILQDLIIKLAKDDFDLSNLSGYPSTIGGAVVVNSGLLGNSIGDYLISAKVFNIKKGEFEEWQKSDFNFQYRSSKLKLLNSHIVFEIVLNIPKGENIEEKVKNIIKERIEKQPQGRSAGCFFKNPDFGYAGKLIDEAGLKGFKIGGACVSEKHGNFLMTEKGASKEDLFDLFEYVKNEVHKKFGIELEEEVVVY